MAEGFTLEDLEPQPFQCHFTWGLESYFGKLPSECIRTGYQFHLKQAKRKENHVEEFSYHMSLAYLYYKEKNMEKHAEHLLEAQQLSEHEPGMLHVFQTNFYFMLHGIGRCFNGKSVDSFAVPYQTLGPCSQAIIWAVRSLSLKSLLPCALTETLNGFEKASSLDPENYQWQLQIGATKRKIQRANKKDYSTNKPELDNFKEVVRLGGPKLNLGIALSELSKDYLMSETKSYHQLKYLMKFVTDLMLEVYSEEHLSGEHYAELGKFFSSIPEPFRNKQLAKKCFEESILIDEDCPYVNHKYAKYLMQQHQNTEALLYLEKAEQCSEGGDFRVSMDWLHLSRDLNDNLDMNTKVQKLLKRFHAPSEKAALYSEHADFLRITQPATALKLYERAVQITQIEGLEHWAERVYKCLWQQQPDGSRKRISNRRYEFQNLHQVIADLKEETSHKSWRTWNTCMQCR